MGHCTLSGAWVFHLSKEVGEPGDLSGSLCSCILWSSCSFMSFHLVEDTRAEEENVIKSLTTSWLPKGWNQKTYHWKSCWSWIKGQSEYKLWEKWSGVTAERWVAEGMVFCLCMGISFACFNGVSRSLMRKWDLHRAGRLSWDLWTPCFPQSQDQHLVASHPHLSKSSRRRRCLDGHVSKGLGSFSAGSLVFSVMPVAIRAILYTLMEWMNAAWTPSCLTEVQEKVHQLNMTGEGSSHISAPVGLGILALNKFA